MIALYRILLPGGRLVVTDYREARSTSSALLMRVFLFLFEPRWMEELFHGGLECQVESARFVIETVRLDLPLTRLIVARKP